MTASLDLSYPATPAARNALEALVEAGKMEMLRSPTGSTNRQAEQSDGDRETMEDRYRTSATWNRSPSPGTKNDGQSQR